VSHYYLDASALAKRYVDEVGSDWLRAAIDPGQSPLIFSSRLSILEIVSALVRRLREGRLTAAEYATARDAFRSDCIQEYQIMPPTMAVVDQAADLLEPHVLRAYDATHLATALNAQGFLASRSYAPLTFLSADAHLNQAAAAEGLPVDNPNAHP